MTDPIADMLTRIRNAHMALHKEVSVPRSKMKEALAGILKQEGYVKVDRRRGVMVAVDIDRMRAIEEIREDLLVTLAKASCKNISGEEVHALIDEIYEEYGKGMRE